jgi:hypothetical protein
MTNRAIALLPSALHLAGTGCRSEGDGTAVALDGWACGSDASSRVGGSH